MPAPLVAGALIAGGASILGAGINAGSTASMNKKTRKWNEQMYSRQRTDALSDWNMQNAYNTPEAQMQRLREAGLNPNLVYGNGADVTAGPTRSTEAKSWNPTPPQVDLSGVGSAFSQYYDATVKQAQVDNMAAQKTLIEQQAIHEGLKAANTAAGTDKTKAETQTLNSLRESQLEALKVSIEKMQTDIQSTSDANKRENQLQPGKMDIQQGTVQNMMSDLLTKRLARTKTQTEVIEIERRILNLRREGILKDIEIDIRQRDGNPNDPYWQKKLQQVLEFLIEGGKDWKRYLDMLNRENPR